MTERRWFLWADWSAVSRFQCDALLLPRPAALLDLQEMASAAPRRGESHAVQSVSTPPILCSNMTGDY